MPISKAEFLSMEVRLAKNRRDTPPADTSHDTKQERDLHEAIENFCDHQWPRWMVIRARMDKKSTIAEGAQDFTIFLPDERVLCIECKAKDKKRTPKQLEWCVQMGMLKHTVHEVRSFERFMEIVRQIPNLTVIQYVPEC